MSSLTPGDEDLHHSDGAHRWSGGSDTTQAEDAVWLDRLREHLAAHREQPQQGRPVRRSPRDAVWRRRITRRT